MAKHPREELTFLMIKPDGVRRGLTGEIVRRIEQVGLKIVALELHRPSRKQVDDHYPKNKDWIKRLGEKTLTTYEKFGFDATAELGTTDPARIGILVRKWLIDFMTSAPVVIMAVKGVHAVSMVRKLAGHTMPSDAPLGTIRGDFSVDSAAVANREKRAVFNLVHASETEQEAKHEIKHWFGPPASQARALRAGKSAIHDYKRTDDEVFG